jgi:hypothetical protein
MRQVIPAFQQTGHWRFSRDTEENIFIMSEENNPTNQKFKYESNSPDRVSFYLNDKL